MLGELVSVSKEGSLINGETVGLSVRLRPSPALKPHSYCTPTNGASPLTLSPTKRTTNPAHVVQKQDTKQTIDIYIDYIIGIRQVIG